MAQWAIKSASDLEEVWAEVDGMGAFIPGTERVHYLAAELEQLASSSTDDLAPVIGTIEPEAISAPSRRLEFIAAGCGAAAGLLTDLLLHILAHVL